MNVLKLQIIKYFIEMMINKTTPLSFILKIKVLNKTKRAIIVSVSNIFFVNEQNIVYFDKINKKFRVFIYLFKNGTIFHKFW